jgi:cysteine desulfurase
MIDELQKNIGDIQFNGDSKNKSLYTVLNISFSPGKTDSEMLLFNLDIAGIAASGGSACTSGSNQGSHVLKGINPANDRPSLRFSFSKYNTKEEVDFCVQKLKEILK